MALALERGIQEFKSDQEGREDHQDTRKNPNVLPHRLGYYLFIRFLEKPYDNAPSKTYIKTLNNLYSRSFYTTVLTPLSKPIQNP